LPESRHRRRSARGSAGRGAGATALPSRSRKKKTNYLLLGAFIIIALLVIGSFGLTTIPFGGGGTTGLGRSDKYVEGVGSSQQLMPTRDHLPEGRVISYNTTPPTSGDHWGRWATCGFYPEGLPDERIVHNLEHSNIVVSYNLASPEEVEKLRKAMESISLNRAWGVTRFYDKLEPGTVVVAAWGISDPMKGVDDNRIKKFFETYAGRIGPEKDARGIGIPC